MTTPITPRRRRAPARAARASALALTLLEAAAAAELHIEGAWVRAMPPGGRMTAAYLRCSNRSNGPLQLRAARAAGAAATSLHATRRDAGRVSMRAAPWPVLQPGGLHLMLEGLTRMPVPGESVELCLLSDVGSHCVAAPVRRSAPDAPARHHHPSASEGRR